MSKDDTSPKAPLENRAKLFQENDNLVNLNKARKTKEKTHKQIVKKGSSAVLSLKQKELFKTKVDGHKLETSPPSSEAE